MLDKNAVTEIQEVLRALSFSDPRFPPIVVDGVYGQQTENAVRIFQSVYGLSETGEVDFETWEFLQNVWENIKPVKPLSPEIFPHPDFLLRPGEDHELAAFLQGMINSISPYYDNISTVNITGRYDPATVAAIRTLQAIAGLAESGVVDRRTWDALASAFNHRRDTAKE